MAINKRKRMIDEVDKEADAEGESQDSDGDEVDAVKKDASQKYFKPSDEARQRITDDGM